MKALINIHQKRKYNRDVIWNMRKYNKEYYHDLDPNHETA